MQKDNSSILISFELSGEHPDIPAAEVTGALEAENIDHAIVYRFERLLIISSSKAGTARMSILAGRLAMTWHIMEVLGISEASLPGIIAMARAATQDHPAGCTYNVRAKKIKRNILFSSEQIEREIGKVLFTQGHRADLKNPEIQYRAVLTDGRCVFGRIMESVDRSAFELRNPQNKPFFYPGVLMPRLARALANIARVAPGKIMLDPYCGTGGILVEAGLLGAEVLGCDVQKMILLGARMNLDFYGVNYSILLQDAGDMALKDECIDCILTDPPYGRSAHVKGQSLDDLMQHSIQEIYRVLRPGGHAVIVSELPLEYWAQQAGFVIRAVYTQRVHRSLTRRFTVLDRC